LFMLPPEACAATRQRDEPRRFYRRAAPCHIAESMNELVHEMDEDLRLGEE